MARRGRVRDKPETKAHDEEMVEETAKSKLIENYDTKLRVEAGGGEAGGRLEEGDVEEVSGGGKGGGTA